MRLGIVTCIWGRHELACMVAGYYSSIEVPGVELTLVAVGSEGGVSRAIMEPAGWEYVEHPNQPLSDKFNAGVKHLQHRVDAVMIIGSDDFLNIKAIEYLVRSIQAGQDAMNLDDLYYYSVEEDALYEAARVSPGASMTMSARLLDRLGWEPWPKGHNRMLDGKLRNRIHKDGFPCKYSHVKNCLERGLFMVDVKTDENMWSVKEMASMTGRVRQVPTEELDKYLPGLRDYMNQNL